MCWHLLYEPASDASSALHDVYEAEKPVHTDTDAIMM